MEHPFRTIVKQFKTSAQTGDYPQVILLCGREDFLINWAKKFIKEQVVEPSAAEIDFSSFSDENSDPYEIAAACETLPLMSRKKLVIVDDHPALTSASGADAQPLADYIARPSSSCILVFACAKPNKTRTLYKAIAKHGLIYDFTALDEDSLSGWMAKRLRAAGKSAEPRDRLRFAKEAGYWDKDRSYTLYNLENDLKKLFALSDKPVLTREDFLSTAEIQPDTQAFRILDAAFSGAKGTALMMLRSSLQQVLPSKEDGVIFQFLGLLCSQLEIMVEARERRKDGQNMRQIEADMGVNGFRLRKCVESSEEKSLSDLKRDLSRAYEIEEEIKGGLMPAPLAMELFIASL